VPPQSRPTGSLSASTSRALTVRMKEPPERPSAAYAWIDRHTRGSTDRQRPPGRPSAPHWQRSQSTPRSPTRLLDPSTGRVALSLLTPSPRSPRSTWCLNRSHSTPTAHNAPTAHETGCADHARHAQREHATTPNGPKAKRARRRSQCARIGRAPAGALRSGPAVTRTARTTSTNETIVTELIGEVSTTRPTDPRRLPRRWRRHPRPGPDRAHWASPAAPPNCTSSSPRQAAAATMNPPHAPRSCHRPARQQTLAPTC
jgi:hypothetical protein